MPFQVKDLLVDVVSASAQGGQAAQLCTFHTLCGCSIYISHPCFNHTIIACGHGCTFITPVTCQFGSHTIFTPGCGGTIITDPTGPILHGNPINFAVLKDQLRQQLAAAEAAEKVQQESLRPQTVEQVDMLAKKMGESLEALKARRAELQPYPPTGSK